MSGPGTMYALKPIVSLPSTSIRGSSMYEMRNIHENEPATMENSTGNGGTAVPDIGDQVTSFLKSPLPEFVALEARQEKILVQLAELKKQVSTLRDFLKQTNQADLTDNCKNQEPVNVKLIINVNPKRPPYSLLALRKVWNDTDFRVQTFVHSTVTGEVPSGYESKNSATKDNVVNLYLIWKDVEDLEVISSLCGRPVSGEINFLRYTSRLLNGHGYEASPCLEQVQLQDTILDLCHCLIFEEAQKRRQEILGSIAEKLNRTAGQEKEASIADIAAWSVIKQQFPNECPSKLDKWFETCEKRFL